MENPQENHNEQAYVVKKLHEQMFVPQVKCIKM